MKHLWLYVLFFTLSIILIFLSIENNAKNIHLKRMEILRLSKIQKVCMKTYLRKRNMYVPQRSLEMAQKKIDKLLFNEPILFVSNQSDLDSNKTIVTLKKVLAVVNHLKEESILSITTHTDSNGTNKHNLMLSQKRADVLKKYFREKSELPLIVSVGYGEEIPLDKEKDSKNDRRVEINLKRIQK